MSGFGAGLGTSKGDSDKIKCPAVYSLVGGRHLIYKQTQLNYDWCCVQGLRPAEAAHSSWEGSGQSIREK